jgi:hypothetical protein
MKSFKRISGWLALGILFAVASIPAATLLNLATQVQGLLPVANGGSGVGTHTAHGVLIGEGTSAVATTAVGNTAQCFLGSTGADPGWGACPNGSISFADAEVPSGTINGSNTSFTLANAPSPAGSLILTKNGVVQKAGGTDYTLSSLTITYAAAPVSGDALLAWYRF